MRKAFSEFEFCESNDERLSVLRLDKFRDKVLVIAELVDQGLVAQPLDVLHEVVRTRVTCFTFASLLSVLWFSRVNAY